MTEQLSPSGKLDLSAVAGFHSELVALSGNDIQLDLGDVSLFGALCVQACVAAARDARENGCRFEVLNASDAVLLQLSAMGFTPETLAEEPA